MRDFSGIRAISFDGDGTLWDFEKVMRYSLCYVLEELEKTDTKTASMLNIEKMVQIRNRVADQLKGKVTNLELVRLEAFRQTLRDVCRPNDELALYLNQVYLKHRFENIKLYSDVLPTLKALQEKFVLGLLSNGNSYPEKCGLENVFQFIIFSQDYGVEKPDPKIFHIAMEKAGCSKNELLHIGDSLKTDITGAVNAGIKSVWLNRKNERRKPQTPKPHHEIRSLSELLDILS